MCVKGLVGTRISVLEIRVYTVEMIEKGKLK